MVWAWSPVLVLALLCGCNAAEKAEAASAEATQITSAYEMGDTVEAFTLTLSDGSTVTLSGLLKEKKAVMLNFWASWCAPCKLEFPYLQQAYSEVQDDVAVLAVDIEKTDTDDTVLAFKEELNLSGLPMGLDSIGLAQAFGVEAYPATVIIDRNGVVCFSESGGIPDKNSFLRLFALFTADDYTDPMMVYEIPSVAPNIDAPTNEALAAALQIKDERITVMTPTDIVAWPFLPDESGTGIVSTNGAYKNSLGAVRATVTVQAGEALAYDVTVKSAVGSDGLNVAVDKTVVKNYGGEAGWRTDYVTFDTAGSHTVSFVLNRSLDAEEEATAQLRSFRLLSAPEVAALKAKNPPLPQTLQGSSGELEVLEGKTKDVIIDCGKEDILTSMVWLVSDKTLRARANIGKEVNPDFAYLSVGGNNYKLNNLEHDQLGYLFDIPMADTEGGGVMVALYASAEDLLASAEYFASEADIDNMVQLMQSYFDKYDQGNKVTWRYADGTPRQTKTVESTENAGKADGLATYNIAVTDAKGKPVEGVTVQMCSASTCQVATTDADGTVTLTATPYAYEIQILRAPAGYTCDAATYTMPEEGGNLTIALP